MKVVYINGFNGHNSNKPKKLSEILNINIEHIKLYIDEDGNINYEDIKEKSKNADLIIASSTGAYVAQKICYEYNIPLVSLNGILTYDELEKVFKKLNHKIKFEDYGRVSIERLILVNKDDDLVDPNHSLGLGGIRVLFERGGHRFENLEETKNFILDFINHIQLMSS